MADGHSRGSFGLRDRFPSVSTPEWEAAIRTDLEGADYEQRLLWRIEDGLTARLFYREEHLAGLEAQVAARPGQFPFVRGSGGRWSIEERFDPPADAIRADRWHDDGAGTIQEVGWSLAEGVDRLASLVGQGHALDEAAGSITFVFAVGSTYFVEIAKLRAVRLAWSRAVAAFGAGGDAARMRLMVRTARSNKSVVDPYTNLLRATTEAMAAIIGGGERIVVEPFGFDPHLAANVQRILEHEALLGLVDDAGGGSYFVESLTDAIARGAWGELQRIEAAGGFSAAAGEIEATLARQRVAREQAVATRRRTLVGVNNYPAPDAQGAATALEAEEARGWRLAVPFERIRARTSSYAAAAGRQPSVLLITRGDVRLRMARANFARNFFGCAGFAARQADAPDGEPADLVVLCSSDAEYQALAQDICPRVPVPVIVAGNPKDRLEALRAAGVQGFVHAGSDMVQTLTEWQDRLGIR
jgi:methylmalonyl-CoA mutase